MIPIGNVEEQSLSTQTCRRSVLIRLADYVGGWIFKKLYEIGSAVAFVCSTLSLIFRRPFQFHLLVRQLLLVGVNSLPVVLVSGIFTGMVLATQGYHQLKDLSAEGSVGRFVSVSVVKELGPMVTAFILAGRIGASITAELGTMKVTEQIDALDVMATSPVKYLVVPRFLACAIMLPLLTTFSIVFGIVGGYFTAVYILPVKMNGNFFLEQARAYIYINSVVVSLIKSSTFGADRRELVRSADVRYAHQGSEVTVELAARVVDAEALETMIQEFHREHHRLFGFSLDQPVEIVTLRVTAWGHLESARMAPLSSDLSNPAESLLGQRPVYFGDAGGFVPCNIYDRARLAPGSIIDGPAILENVDSTVVIDPGWQARIDHYGNCIMRPV